MPHDGEGLSDDDDVLRRVSAQLVLDDGKGGKRISSAVFSKSSKKRDPYEGISVDIADCVRRQHADLSAAMHPDQIGALSLRVGFLRELEFLVGSDPLEDNECHASIWKHGNISKSTKRALLRAAVWAYKADGLEIND